MSEEVSNFFLRWSPMNYLESDDENHNEDQDLQNVLLQLNALDVPINTNFDSSNSEAALGQAATSDDINDIPMSDSTTNLPQNADLADKQFDIEFLNLDEAGVQNFLDRQQNKNTAKKTHYDLLLVSKFMKMKNETRELQLIPPAELDPLLSNFILTVRKKDGKEFEPSTIRGIISSVDRKLKRHKYGHSIMGDQNDESFNLTRQTLKAKQKLLKQKGKGNKPKRAQPLTDDEINMLFEKGLLGDSTPTALLNTVWWNNCVQFGLRGVSEHYSLRWGDVTLNTASDGVKYLELNERQTKTRTGENVGDIREVAPKIFETKGDRDPIKIYEMYKSKRPLNFSNDDDPFYLAPRTIPLDDKRSDLWYLRQRIGERKLGSIVKKTKEDGNLDENKRLTNHSARKYLVQKLGSNEVPDTDIMQISGHKNVNSVNSYSSISENKQRKISNILSNTTTETKKSCPTSTMPTPTVTAPNLPCSAVSQPVNHFDDNNNLQPSFSSQMNMSNRISSMFSGAILHINSLNVYLAPPQQEWSPALALP